jgi:biotin carboxylase
MSRPLAVVVGANKRLLTSIHRSRRYRIALLEEPHVIAAKRVAATIADIGADVTLIPVAYQQSRDLLSDPRVAALAPAAIIPGQEYAVPAAAALAEQRGRPGAGSGAAAVLTDKIRLRQVTEGAGMTAPPYREVRSARQVGAFVAAQGPAVLKPANRQASVGVELLDPDSDVEAAWQRCVTASDPGQLAARPMRWRYLVEAYVPGAEVSVESLVRRGRVIFTNVTAKRLAVGRHPVELGHDVPAQLGAGLTRRLEACQQQLCAAVGFRDGFLHSEWKTRELPDSAVLIECAGRTPGDSIVPLIERAYGFDPYIGLVDLLAGDEPLIARRAHRSASIRFLPAAPGRFAGVDGIDAARREPAVSQITVLAEAGDVFTGVQNSWDRVAQVICQGADGPAVARAADGALRRLGVRVEREEAAAHGAGSPP